MTDHTRIPLARLSPELNDRYGSSPGYRKLHQLALDGALRTELVNGRHYVREASLPDIAVALGLTPKAAEHSRTIAAEHIAA